MKILKILWYVSTLYGPIMDAIMGIKSGIDRAKCDADYQRYCEERQHFCDVEFGLIDDLKEREENK